MTNFKQASLPVFLLVAIAAIFIGISADLSSDGTTYADVGYTYNDSTHTLTLTATTEGEMPNYVIGKAPWYSKATDCTSIEWDSKITSIGDWAFYGFSSLTAFEVPAAVSKVGVGSFAGTGIAAFTVHSGNSSFSASGGLLLNKAGTGIIVYPSSKSGTSFDVPAGITSIADGAFSHAKYLTDFTTSSLSFSVIAGSPGIFSANAQTMIAYPPANASSTYVMPSTVKTLSKAAFGGSTHLTAIDTSTSLTTIGDYAFVGSSDLSTVNLEYSLQTMGNYLFNGTILSNIELPANLSTVSPLSFDECSSLLRIEVADGNQKYRSDDGVLMEILTKDSEGMLTQKLVKWPQAHVGTGSAVKDTWVYVIPVKTTDIGDYALQGCTKMRDVVFTNDVVKLGYKAFSGCSALGSVHLNHGLTTIRTVGGSSYVFEDCVRLLVASIPTTLSSLPKDTFAGCTNLRAVVVDQDDGKTVGCAGAFPTWASTTVYKFDISDKTPAYASAGEGLNSLGEGCVYTTHAMTSGYQSSKDFYNEWTSTRSGSVAGNYYHVFFFQVDGKTTKAGIITTTGYLTTNYDETKKNINGEKCSQLLLQYGCPSIGFHNFEHNDMRALTIPTSVTSAEWGALVGTDITVLVIPRSIESIPFKFLQGTGTVHLIAEDPTKIESDGFALYSGTSVISTLRANAGQIIIKEGTVGAYSGVHRESSMPIIYPDSMQGLGVNTNTGSMARLADGQRTVHADIEGGTVLLGNNCTLTSTSSSEKNAPIIVIMPSNLTAGVQIQIRSSLYSYDFSSEQWSDTKLTGLITHGGGLDKSLLAYDKLQVHKVSDTLFWIINDKTLIICGTGAIPDYTVPTGANPAPWFSADNASNIEAIAIQRGITGIGTNAFNGFAKLIGIGLPNTIQTISAGAFANCGTADALGLNGVYIPTSCIDISPLAFSGDIHFSRFIVSESNGVYRAVDGVLYNKAGTALISYPKALVGSYQVLEGCKTIGAYAFQGCALSSIDLNEVVTISQYAFNGSALRALSSSTSLQTIGADAFLDCKSFKSATISSTVKSVGDYAFSGTPLTTIIVQEITSDITPGTGAIPTTKTWYDTTSDNFDVWDGALIKAKKVYSTINVDTSVFIGPTLRASYLSESYTVKIKGSGDMYNYDASGSATDVGVTATIPWLNYKSSVKAISLSEGMTSIGDYGFAGLNMLTWISLPSSISDIGDHALEGSGVVTIYSLPTSEPASMISYGTESFAVTGSSIDVMCNYQQPSKEFSPFVSDPSDADVTFTYHYAAHSTSGTVDSWWHVESSNTKLVLTGTDMGDYTVGNSPWAKAFGSTITSYQLATGKHVIGSYAFSGCTALKEVELESDASYYHANAFTDSGIETVNMPASLILTTDAFNGCTGIRTVNLATTDSADYTSGQNQYQPWMKSTTQLTLTTDSSVLSIGEHMFSGCTALAYLQLHANTVTFDPHCFQNCTGLQELDLTGIKTLGTESLYGLSGLKELTLPITLTATKTFDGMTSLATVNVKDKEAEESYPAYTDDSAGQTDGTYRNTPWFGTNVGVVNLAQGITKIPAYMFKGSGLASVTIPESVTDIGTEAFKGCSTLVVVNLLCSDAPTIGDYVFDTGRLQSDAGKYTTICCRFTGWNDGTEWIGGMTVYDSTGDKKYNTTTTLQFEDGTPYIQCGDSLFFKWIPYQTYEGDLDPALLAQSKVVTFLGSGSMWEFVDSGATGKQVNRPWIVGQSYITYQMGEPQPAITINPQDIDRITTLHLTDGMTSIGANAFKGLYNLEKIYYGTEEQNKLSLPTTVISIGANAFDGCSKIGFLDARNVKTIGNLAFNGCRDIEWILLPHDATLGTTPFLDSPAAILYATGTSGKTDPSPSDTILSQAPDMRIVMLTGVEGNLYVSGGVACVTETMWSDKNSGEWSTSFGSGNVYVTYADNPTSGDNVYTASTNSTISFTSSVAEEEGEGS